jgi:Transport and Golgi organisation 2
MCTVSFVNTNQQIIITSNRDEKTVKTASLPLQEYVQNGVKLFYPKDTAANGTWFVTKQNGAMFVLLNGAEIAHESVGNYRKSRGLIVLDLANAADVFAIANNIFFENIEPCTIIHFDTKKLFTFIWDGQQLFITELATNENYIWSSSTLYTAPIAQQRKNWFEKFLSLCKNKLDKNVMLEFHSNTQPQDAENGLVINRRNTMHTKSITQYCCYKNKDISLHHKDLVNQSISKISIVVSEK